jgi:broad specificity phosphatase PhoE
MKILKKHSIVKIFRENFAKNMLKNRVLQSSQMELYVVRHGQTYANLLGLCDSNIKENAKLTGLGIKQAEAAAIKLKKIKFDKMFVSELFRTHQTGDIINKFHKLKYVQDSRLDDIETGFDGLPDDDYQKAMREAKDKWNARFNDGESFEDRKKLIFDFLDDLKKKKYRRVLIVTHEHTIKVFRGYFENLSNEDMVKRKFKNCEIVRFMF